MTDQDAIFGNLSHVSAVRRVGSVCIDRMDDDGLAALMGDPDPAPFGSFRRIRQITRH